MGNQPLTTPPAARAVEQCLFGALLGSLASTLVCRFLLLAFDVPVFLLASLLIVGAAGGAFVAHFAGRSADSVVGTFRTWNTLLRRISLRVMLWLLALAALIGVLTVLTADYDTLGRVAGTVISTAVIAGVVWPLSFIADSPRSQSAGLLGMAAAFVVYMLVIPLIWDLDTQTEAMLLTSLIIGLTTPFGMFFLWLTNVPAAWIAARVGVGSYASVVVTFLVAAWHPGRWSESENWWITGWWIACYGALMFASLTGMRRLSLNWRWLGVAAAVLAWALIMIGVWGQTKPSQNLIVGLSSFAVVIGHASLAMLVPLKPGQAWLRYGTIAAVATAAVFVDAELLFGDNNGLTLLGRIAGAAAVVASSGSLALMILARLNRNVGADYSRVHPADLRHIVLICPRCQTKLKGEIGAIECSQCGLVIHVEVREPAASPFGEPVPK